MEAENIRKHNEGFIRNPFYNKRKIFAILSYDECGELKISVDNEYVPLKRLYWCWVFIKAFYVLLFKDRYSGDGKNLVKKNYENADREI